MQVYQPNLFSELPPITDRYYFTRQFERLENEQLTWVESLPFEYPEDLHFDDFLYWFRRRLNKKQKAWADNFVTRWFDLVEIAEREQICFDCRKYTHVSVWFFHNGQMRCKQCIKKLKN